MGNTNIGATWTAFLWDMNPNNTCTKTTIHPVPAAVCDVQASPHHVKVILDQQGFPASCASTGIYVRQIKVQVVDASNNNITAGFSVEESFANLSTNSCGNSNPMPSSCAAADTGGQFLDSMAVSGNVCNSGISQGSGCGFTVDSTWSICSGATQHAIWSSSRETRSNSVKVNGQSSSYSSGTFLYP